MKTLTIENPMDHWVYLAAGDVDRSDGNKRSCRVGVTMSEPRRGGTVSGLEVIHVWHCDNAERASALHGELLGRVFEEAGRWRVNDGTFRVPDASMWRIMDDLWHLAVIAPSRSDIRGEDGTEDAFHLGNLGWNLYLSPWEDGGWRWLAVRDDEDIRDGNGRPVPLHGGEWVRWAEGVDIDRGGAFRDACAFVEERTGHYPKPTPVEPIPPDLTTKGQLLDGAPDREDPGTLKRIVDNVGSGQRHEIDGWVVFVTEMDDGWAWAMMPPGECRTDSDGFVVSDLSRTRWAMGYGTERFAMTAAREYVARHRPIDMTEEVRRYADTEVVHYMGWMIRVAHIPGHGWCAAAWNQSGGEILTTGTSRRDALAGAMGEIEEGASDGDE